MSEIRGSLVNEFPFFNNMDKENIGLRYLRKSGYSLIRIIGKDGSIKNYLKKVRAKDVIYIGNNPKRGYLINHLKKFTSDGMPEYLFFITSPIGIDYGGSGDKQEMDSKIVTEMIDYASLVGEKSVDGGKGSMVQIIIGLSIGFILAMLLSSFGFI
jgi:hypothetical protein